ncbi:MAG: hypothetical protein V3W44_09835 [Dehalococcoidales bacterium]
MKMFWDKGTGKTASIARIREEHGPIGLLANRMILDPEGHSYREILVMMQEEFPHAQTTLNCLRWYASQLRKRGLAVPERPHGNSGS